MLAVGVVLLGESIEGAYRFAYGGGLVGAKGEMPAGEEDVAAFARLSELVVQGGDGLVMRVGEACLECVHIVCVLVVVNLDLSCGALCLRGVRSLPHGSTHRPQSRGAEASGAYP